MPEKTGKEKRILIISTVGKQFWLFEQGNIEILSQLGYEVHGAANFLDDNDKSSYLKLVKHHICFERSPYSMQNIKAYKQLVKLLRDYQFTAIHCHSPMGGVIGRIAARRHGIDKIIYTAHGFHFYKGAPVINWLLYYPVEKWLSSYTNLLITLNLEDYNRAKKFQAQKIIQTPGVGFQNKSIDDMKIAITKAKIRCALGIPSDAFVLISVGELNNNKNHGIVIDSVHELTGKNLHYIICGDGHLLNKLRKMIDKYQLSHNIHLVGYQDNVWEYCLAADLFVFPSKREGLPVSLMEAMALRLPVVCSNIRGNIDLIQDGIGGILVEPEDVKQFTSAITYMIDHPEFCRSAGDENYWKSKQYTLENVKKVMRTVYGEFLNDNITGHK
jgi:glycosyltransferase involved in cell wall biosynthesis